MINMSLIQLTRLIKKVSFDPFIDCIGRPHSVNYNPVVSLSISLVICIIKFWVWIPSSIHRNVHVMKWFVLDHTCSVNQLQDSEFTLPVP